MAEHKQNKKLFVDLGGHTGETIERFFWEVPDAVDWDVISFEPLVYLYLMNNTERYRNVTVIPKAAWIENTDLQFYVDESTKTRGIGSTALKGKLTGAVNYKKPVKVKAIDFAEWLKNIQAEYDYIVVKMNIEGSEYVLMPQFIERNLLDKIDELYIEVHHRKFDLPERIKFRRIENEFIKKARKHKTKLYYSQEGGMYFQCKINCGILENGQ